MSKPTDILEVFLHSGEYFFGDNQCRIRTILGSCVSITFWHPKKLIGAMCHVVLPTRNHLSMKKKGDFNHHIDLDPKYADEAFALIVNQMNNEKTTPKEYQVKMFGGGNMLSNLIKQNRVNDIGLKNIRYVEELLDIYGFNCKVKNIGGEQHRYIVFDIWSGHVWMKRNREIHEKNKSIHS